RRNRSLKLRPVTLICPRLLPAWLILFFLLPTFAQTEQPRYGGSVVIAINDDPGGLNPAITTQGTAHLVTGSIFSGLVRIYFTLRPRPDLATSWEVAPDGKRYTFQLAQNAIFHDAKPVPSANV